LPYTSHRYLHVRQSLLTWVRMKHKDTFMYAFFKKPPSFLHFFLIFCAAFLIRSITFHWYVQHEERYCQPDSNDYHAAAWCITKGYGMHYPNGRPMFWRTPGYPAYLSLFYDKYQYTNGTFAEHVSEHKTAIWFQIFLCSLLPLLMFYLAFILTKSNPIAWLASLISVVHLGFVLASTFLLTDALASLFFILFLVCLYQSFSLGNFILKKEPLKATPGTRYLIFAALSLAIYTWMRPMGQFVALACIPLFVFSAGSWKIIFKKIAYFFIIFAACLFPWFWRNYQLTGKWFFCPLFGLYLNCFNAPKILARVEHIPLPDAHKKLAIAASYATGFEYEQLKRENPDKVVVGEMVHLQTALPLIKEHPWYFLYDWITEVTKTTFDLYASQLVAFAANCFKWDPIVEYLDEKIAKCLYAQPMSWLMRTLAWVEFLSVILLWMGILGGVLFFMCIPLIKKQTALFQTYGLLWIKTGIVIGAVLMQTGGFGYARLRLPIEPLMLILGITFWWWILTQKTNKETNI
jgi:hypothetical protein